MTRHMTPAEQYHHECAASWRQYANEDAAPRTGWEDDNKRGERGRPGGKDWELGQRLRARSLRVQLIESGVLVPREAVGRG